MAPNKARDGAICTRKMKLNAFINEDFIVGEDGRDGLPEETQAMLPLLGTTGDDGQLLTIQAVLTKFSKFVSLAHIFGSKVQLLSFIRMCEQFGTDYKQWPDVHKQQFYVQCSNRYAVTTNKFPPSVMEARNIIMPIFDFSVDSFQFNSAFLDDLGVRMLTDTQNHLKRNLHRFLKRDVTLHCSIIHPSNSISKKYRKKLQQQIFCVIIGRYFSGKMLKELELEETVEYILHLRHILGLGSDFVEEADKLKEAQKLVSQEGETWSNAQKRVGLGSSVIRDENWVVKGKENMIRAIVCFYELLHSREKEQQQLAEKSFLKKFHHLCPQGHLHHLHYHKFGFKQLYVLLKTLGYQFPSGVLIRNYSKHGQNMWSTLFNTRLVGKQSKSITQQFADCFYTDGVAVSALAEKIVWNGSPLFDDDDSTVEGIEDDDESAGGHDEESESEDELDGMEVEIPVAVKSSQPPSSPALSSPASLERYPTLADIPEIYLGDPSECNTFDNILFLVV